MLVIDIGNLKLTVSHDPEYTRFATDYWWFDLHRDGSYRLWPTAQFTYDLACAYTDGTISWKSAGIVYATWHEDMLPKVIKLLSLLGFIKCKEKASDSSA